MRVLILLLSLTLSGCVKYVYVPVATCPKPPVVQEQPLKSYALKDNAGTDEILLALAWDISYLKALKERYRILLDGYNTPQWVIEEPKP